MTRVALIGHGRWGKNIARTLGEIPGCELVHVISSAKELTRADFSDIDGVLIATPGSTHAEIAIPFLKQGIPLFIEKPLTTSLLDAKRLEKWAKKTNTPVMVGHIHLYNPAYQKAKQLLPNIGAIQHIHAEGMNTGPVRDDMSALWDWAPHDLSMILDIMGTKPISVQAWGIETLRPGKNLQDVVFVKILFPKNITATIHNSWISPEKRKKVSIIGSKKSILYDDTAQKKVTLTAPSSSQHPRYGATSPLELELRAFVSMITRNTDSLTRIDDAVEVVRLLDAAQRSLQRSGKEIMV